MVEFERTDERELAPSMRMKICVAGVGGGGLNVLDRISLDRMMDATLVSMHTDVRVLGHAMTPVKIQLGSDRMRGIGSGGDPENGYAAAIDTREQIRTALQGHDMVFVCCGLGGGTGSGAAPVVAEVAKEIGAMVFVFATMPFSFEGRRRIQQAEVALEHLGQVADALILFENNRMGELTLPKEGIQKAFSQADQLIGHSVRAIATMVMQPGIVRMGIADLLTALRGPNSRCLFGFGEARGTNRVADALKRALKSPLVNQGMLLQNARNLLVHVAGGESLTLAEVESLMKQLGKYVPEETQIMFGLAVEPKLGDMISVTLVSSLSVHEMSPDSVLGRTERSAPVESLPAIPAVEVPVAETYIAPQPQYQPQPAPVPVHAAEPVYYQNGQNGHAPQPVVQAAVTAAPAPAPVQAPAPAPVAEVAPQPVFTAPVQVQAPAPQPAPQPEPQLFQLESPGVVEPDLFFMDAPAPVQNLAPAPVPAPVVTSQPQQAPQPQSQPEPIKSSFFIADDTPDEEEVEAQAPEPQNFYSAPAEVPAEENEDVLRAEEQLYQQQPQAPVEAPAPAPAPAKSSIFSIIEDEEDEGGSAPASYPDVPGGHWADKYANQSSSRPEAATAAVASTVVAAAPQQAAAPGTPGKPGSDFKQSTFDLSQEEVARFKGTDKTIVEGEDLDVPTWMRMRQKLKR
ncbi:cell division protein FtsZ [Verrucomicrobium sp. BvORR106]|uniref:cell division protein FtsZ n=1 Tax=Verrucomicrobium sp. BvORR106 TaxID=1403819 RepID=UPI00056E5C28|nr:cell division protein FtsZ [Verrucomicrobium sp. BvORR106]